MTTLVILPYKYKEISRHGEDIYSKITRLQRFNVQCRGANDTLKQIIFLL